MELWIRTQNKKILTKIEDVYIDHEFQGIYSIECSKYQLGTYKSEERALKIINEIQNILMPEIICNPIVEEKILPNENYVISTYQGSTMEIKELSTYVYQMPKE